MNATTLDQVLAASMRLAGAGILFVAPSRFRGPDPDGVLLVRTKNGGTWELPGSVDVARDVRLDGPEPFGDCLLLARCDVEFEPTPNAKYDDFCWTSPEFAVCCTGTTHPTAIAAIKKFIAGSGDSQPSGELKMESRSEFVAAQAKADRVYRVFGDQAPPFLNGESLLAYRQRLARPFQVHSKAFKEVDLSKCGCPNALTVFENQIYLDASTAVLSGATAGPGQLVPIVTMDASNRPITRYVSSDDGACWDRHNPPPRIVKGGIGALALAAKGHMQ